MGIRKKTWMIIMVVAVLATVIVLFAGIRAYQSVLERIPRAEYVENSITQEEIDAILGYTSDVSEKPALPDEAISESTERKDDGVINVMVIGQSSRPGETYHMADTMILVTVNTNTKVMTLTSFLRDAYLKIPDYTDLSGRQHSFGMQRLNLCYHLGHSIGATADAMKLLDQCLYENFGVEVDFNIEIGFEGVEKVVNYFGGVEVDLTEAEAEYLNKDTLYVLDPVSPGPQLLDGMAALSYVRMRSADGDAGSDIKRTGRQRLLLEKLMEKIRNSSVDELFWLMEDFLPYVVTDMTDADITRCLLEIFPLVPQLQIETGTCPVKSTYWGEILGIGGFDTRVLRFDEEENRRLMTALTEGT